MKICYLNYIGGPTIRAADNNTIGGLNTILFNLAVNVSTSEDYEVEVVYRDDGLPGSGALNEIKIITGKTELIGRKEAERLLPLFIKRAAEYIMFSRPDLVHTSGSEAGQVMLSLRSQEVNIPWVHTNYATLSVRRAIIDGLLNEDAVNDIIGAREKQCLLNCDVITALSANDKKEISSVFSIPGDKIFVVEPGIDHSIFFPGRLFRPEKIIISAGRISKVKDFPFLLKAFEQVKKFGNQEAKLIIVGGNQKERHILGLDLLVKELNIANDIEFVDGVSQENLACYFRKAKVFAAHSQHETFGLLPVEARACGLPFVARANSGYISTSSDGFGGYLSQNNSEYDMAQKINSLLNMSIEKWTVMSAQAEKSASTYRWSDSAKKLSDIYKMLLTS